MLNIKYSMFLCYGCHGVYNHYNHIHKVIMIIYSLHYFELPLFIYFTQTELHKVYKACINTVGVVSNEELHKCRYTKQKHPHTLV